MPRLFFLISLIPTLVFAQLLPEEGVYKEDWGGYYFGVRGGLSLGSQDWSNIDTELNLGLHGDLFLESIPAGGNFILWGQLGYHQRGSRISRRRVITFQGNGITLPADNFQFNNIVLSVGGKQLIGYTALADLYYVLGVRGEYNLSTNLGEYDRLSASQGIAFRNNYPINSYEFINRFTYGITAGAGANFLLADAIGVFAELTAQPDLNFQYNQGQINNVINPSGPGNTTLGERAIRNFTIELSVGLRFLRHYTYLD